MTVGRAVLAVLAVAGLVASGSPAASAASCPKDAQCATLDVALDHSGATPGTLPLAYARVPATGTRTGTLVLLSGGPGQAAIPLTEAVSTVLKPLRETYDLVFVDQRGTGRSGAVECSAVSDCVAKLGARRAFLNTPETASDLEDLRAALHVDRLTLLGVSYGAKVAAEYVRRYPAQTAAVILDSPAPVDGLDAVGTLPGLGTSRVLNEICSPGPCVRTVGDASKALAAATARLQRGTVKGPLVSGRGRVRTVAVGETALYRLVRASDLNPVLRAGLPAAIASLAAGDAAPLLHLSALVTTPGGEDASVNAARLLATTCSEGRLPWAPDSPVAGRLDALKAFVIRNAGAFAPFTPATVLASSPAALCLQWPPTPRPAAVAYPGPDVPVLVLSGRDDLRTPTEDARRTAAQYPDAKLLAVPGVGHSVLGTDPSGCALAGVVDFLAGKALTQCSARRAPSELLRAAGYVPATVGALRPTKLGGLPGRTLTAFTLTLQKVFEETALQFLSGGSPRLPGLRGGWAQVGRTRIELHGLEMFRGVRFTGTLQTTRDAVSQITVSGPAAAAGTLLVSGDDITGTLGGVALR